MANYYTEFSDELLLNTNEEEEWFRRRLSFAKVVRDDEGRKVRPAEHYNANGPTSPEAKLWDRLTDDDEYSCWEFAWEFDGLNARAIWFHSDDNLGSPYQVCCLVHAFFKEMRPDGNDEFYLTWSDTCDKHRIGAFGGGAMLVTKRGIGTCANDEQYECAKRLITNPWREKEGES